MNFRFLTQYDLFDYKKLKCYGLIESKFAFSDSYEDEVNRPYLDYLQELEIIGNPADTFVLGAFTQTDELIAFVRFKRDRRLKALHKAMVHSLYVNPNFRNQGIAKKMMLELFRITSTIVGLEQIHLWVLISETSVLDFYEKLGFESQGAVVKNDLKFDKRYVDAVYMVKYLKTQ